MKVSVIIPTYNEEGAIRECLISLSHQFNKDLEVIIVDDESTDATIKHISPFTNHHSPITVLHQQHKGPGAARNLGAKHAKGEVLVFVDADMTFAPDFVEKLVKPIILGETKGTFSKDEYVSNWDNVWARCWSINEGWETKRRHPKKYPNKQKVFRAILRSEFEKVGGFDVNRGYNDDWSLSEKLGYKADVVEGAVFYHKNPDNLVEIFEHAKWIGKRSYKFGFVGILFALFRSSFLISVFIGSLYAIRYKLYAFLVFKIIYDFGIFIGILEYYLLGKISK